MHTSKITGSLSSNCCSEIKRLGGFFISLVFIIVLLPKAASACNPDGSNHKFAIQYRTGFFFVQVNEVILDSYADIVSLGKERVQGSFDCDGARLKFDLTVLKDKSGFTPLQDVVKLFGVDNFRAVPFGELSVYITEHCNRTECPSSVRFGFCRYDSQYKTHTNLVWTGSYSCKKSNFHIRGVYYQNTNSVSCYFHAELDDAILILFPKKFCRIDDSMHKQVALVATLFLHLGMLEN